MPLTRPDACLVAAGKGATSTVSSIPKLRTSLESVGRDILADASPHKVRRGLHIGFSLADASYGDRHDNINAETASSTYAHRAAKTRSENMQRKHKNTQ